MPDMPGRYTGSDLIFVVGCARSGTTYLQRLLASHPQITTGQESELFYYVGPLLRRWRIERERQDGRGGIGLACYFTEEEFLQVVNDVLMKFLRPMLRQLQTGMLFLEKTPHHTLYLAEIVQLLPDCRIIHMLRDPREVVASLVAASRSWGKAWAPRYGWKAASIWRKHVAAVEAVKPVIAPTRFCEVRYEALMRDPHAALSKLAGFLGLEWDDDAIAEAVQHNTKEAVRRGQGTAIPLGGEVSRKGGSVVKEPPGFVRGQELEGWLGRMHLRERFWVWLVARKMMKQCGY